MKSNCAKWGNRSLKRYETSLQISELGQIKSIALAKLPVDFHIKKIERRDYSSLNRTEIQMNGIMASCESVDCEMLPKLVSVNILIENEYFNFEFIYT